MYLFIVNAKRQKALEVVDKKIIYNEEEIVSVIDKIMEHYRKTGNKGEKILGVMDRVGKEKFIADVLEKIN